MYLKSIIDKPDDSLIYLERYVNDGSPSGFTFKHTPSKRYSPVNGYKKFRLPILWSEDNSLSIYGDLHSPFINFFKNDKLKAIPLHPDFYKSKLDFFKDFIIKKSKYYVMPTASGRTVFVKYASNKFYLKLHYDGILDRIYRKLPYRKAIAEVEISNILSDSIDKNIFTNNFSIFLAPFCIIKKDICELNEFGFIFREGIPFPKAGKNNYLIPFFSLISKDKYDDSSPYLINQILENSDHKDIFLINKIIRPVLENYIIMVKKLGLIPEINAQNILLEIDKNAKPLRIVLRDLMGIEKDLPIRKALKLSTTFDSNNYKILDTSDKLYYIRHSFSYDFKLSKYIIKPLIEIAFKEDYKKIRKIKNEVKELAIKLWGDFRFDFFKPYDKWYSHPKVLLTDRNKRTYIENKGPDYR